MKKILEHRRSFINEVSDEAYYQGTFDIYALASISKSLGGNRDQTKNDIRAIPEVLTVAVVEPPEGIQRSLPDRFLSTLKIHCRLPRAGITSKALGRDIVQQVQRLRGVKVIRYDLPPEPLAEGETIFERDFQAALNSPSGRANYARMKGRILDKGPQAPGVAYPDPSKTDRGKSAAPILPGGLEEISVPRRRGPKIKIKIGRPDKKLKRSFDVQSELNPEIWAGSDMHPRIRERLRQIAEEFIDNLDLPALAIKDIILTGSLANFNWSNYSDLDVHIVVDFRDIDENEGFVKKYFDAVRSNWNRVHDIKIKGFDVELYVQDDDEKHTSTGVFSLLHNEWETFPEMESHEADVAEVFKKARPLIRDLEKVERFHSREKYAEAIESGNRLKVKLQKMRKAGLEAEGVFSLENLAFKVLRRGGHMKRLYDTVRAAYDASKSLADQ